MISKTFSCGLPVAMGWAVFMSWSHHSFPGCHCEIKYITRWLLARLPGLGMPVWALCLSLACRAVLGDGASSWDNGKHFVSIPELNLLLFGTREPWWG